MSKKYYELKISGDDFERSDRGIYPSIAEAVGIEFEKKQWLVTKGRPLAKEEWSSDFSFKLIQDEVRDQNLYNTQKWCIFSDELCNSVMKEGITGFQFLPIKVYDMEGKIIPNYKTVANIDNKAYCMDMDRSVYKTYRDFFGKESEWPDVVSSDKIISIKRLVLKNALLPETNVFRLGDMFFTITDEKFVDMFTANHYSGFSFTEVEVV